MTKIKFWQVTMSKAFLSTSVRETRNAALSGFPDLVQPQWGPCAYVIINGKLPAASHFVGTAGWQAKMASIELWNQ